MFNLERYIGPSETILLRFGISLRFVITTISIAALILGGLSFYFQSAGFTGFFVDVPLVILGITALYMTAIYLTTGYFATDQKIYKKIGIGFAKVTSAKKTEIDDLAVVQSFTGRFLFGIGTIKFNTPGSAGFEIVLPLVNAPFDTKRQIYDVWGF